MRGSIDNEHSSLAETEVRYLRSQHVGDEFKIHVGLPIAASTTPPSVLFMGDAWANFGAAVEITRLMAYAGDLPPILVVAVGYRAVTVEENDVIRARDFTPTPDPAADLPGAAATGGADAFLAFLRDELKPWVAERYGVDTADATLFGYSLGGLFATHVLLNEPSSFRRYGIGGPAPLDWDGGVLFDREAAYADTHDDLPAKVYFGVAEFDSTEGEARWRSQLPADRRSAAEIAAQDDPPYDIRADTERMVVALRGRHYPTLEIEHEVLLGEYHQTAPFLALSRSLRYLFGAPR